MSADIFQPMEFQADPNESNKSRNPLLCYICNEPYQEPCILGCFHSFCARCLRGRSSEGKMTCPLCSFSHMLKDGSSLPPTDLLLKFMVEASTEEKAQCANCDCTSFQMFFCNTCMQPLCAQCREETHKAKMFSSHDMVLLTKRAREVHKKCQLHEEPYIMFSSEKKIMLCINCFRDMRIESRGHCLDLETAYKQSCKKLDMKVQAFRELQNSVREGILLFRGLMEEIKSNAEKERSAIQELYVNLNERLEETKQILLQKVESQYTEKEVTFRTQLKSLSTLVPTLHTHLVVSSAFLGSANKFEFLDLSYVLMDRLKSIVQKQHPLHATLSGQIDSAFKAEFYKSIEPLLYVPNQRPTLNTAACSSSGVSAVSTGTSCPGSPITSKITPTHVRRQNGLNGAKVKFIDAKGQFAEHCKEFENAHRDLLHRFEQMKNQCQELQRDLTMRRCLAKKTEVMELSKKVEAVQEYLDSHYNILEGKLPVLEKHWEESVERIVNEQDLYQAQLADVMRLKQESQHLRVITSQLLSFVSSIAAVTERLAPKLGQSTTISEQDNQMASLMDEINAVQPDSQVRVEAIRGAEEERQSQIANRTNPLDSELIKTKGLLRCPSLRTLKGERPKQRSSTGTKSATTVTTGSSTTTNTAPDALSAIAHTVISDSSTLMTRTDCTDCSANNELPPITDSSHSSLLAVIENGSKSTMDNSPPCSSPRAGHNAGNSVLNHGKHSSVESSHTVHQLNSLSCTDSEKFQLKEKNGADPCGSFEQLTPTSVCDRKEDFTSTDISNCSLTKCQKSLPSNTPVKSSQSLMHVESCPFLQNVQVFDGRTKPVIPLIDNNKSFNDSDVGSYVSLAMTAEFVEQTQPPILTADRCNDSSEGKTETFLLAPQSTQTGLCESRLSNSDSDKRVSSSLQSSTSGTNSVNGVENAVRIELMKDVEKFNRKECLTPLKKRIKKSEN